MASSAGGLWDQDIFFVDLAFTQIAIQWCNRYFALLQLLAANSLVDVLDAGFPT